MKVYLALRIGVEWTDILGVFDNKSSAQETCDWHRTHPKAHWTNPMSDFEVESQEVRSLPLFKSDPQ